MLNKFITKDAIVGVIVGAIVTYTVQRALDNKRQNQQILGALHGIHAELNTTYKELALQYKKEKWKDFKERDPGRYHLPPFFTGQLQLPEDYAIVYRSNANLIGQINNSDLVDKIVSTHMSLQTFVNNHKKYRTEYSSFMNSRGADMYSSRTVRLGLSALKLIQDHESLTKSIKYILEMLEEEIPLYSSFGFLRRFLRFLQCK